MKCPVCSKGQLSQRIKLQTYTYKGRSIELEQTGLWCNFCGEGILSDADISQTEREFVAFKASILDGRLDKT